MDEGREELAELPANLAEGTSGQAGTVSQPVPRCWPLPSTRTSPALRFP